MIRVGAFIVALTALAALAGPMLSLYDPAAQNLPMRLEGPSGQHPFGLGRDILSRVLAGAQISLAVGLTVVLVSATIGTLLGGMAGYFGSGLDDLIGRVMDVLMAFPGILLAIALVAVPGPSLTNVLFAPAIIGWVGYTRLVPRAGAARARAGVRPGGRGARLDAGRAYLFDAPHLTLFPGMAIALLVLGLNFLEDGLRDRLDPRRG
jgi:peptide/nickel transport system permease protein